MNTPNIATALLLAVFAATSAWAGQFGDYKPPLKILETERKRSEDF